MEGTKASPVRADTSGGYASTSSAFFFASDRLTVLVKGLAQRLAVDIAADGDLVLEPFVPCVLAFLGITIKPFLIA